MPFAGELLEPGLGPRKLETRSIFYGDGGREKSYSRGAHDRTYSWIPGWLSEHDGAPSSREIVLREQTLDEDLSRLSAKHVPWASCRIGYNIPIGLGIQGKNMAALLAVATSRYERKKLENLSIE